MGDTSHEDGLPKLPYNFAVVTRDGKLPGVFTHISPQGVHLGLRSQLTENES